MARPPRLLAWSPCRQAEARAPTPRRPAAYLSTYLPAYAYTYTHTYAYAYTCTYTYCTYPYSY